MVPGLNTNVERNGASFHVQTEDFGRDKPLIQSLVYLRGEVVTALEASYEDYAKSDEFEEAQILSRLTAQHYRLVAQIEAGEFDAVGEAGDADRTEEAASDKVLDYLDGSVPFEPGTAPSQEVAEGLKDLVADRERAAQPPVAAPARERVRIIRHAAAAEAGGVPGDSSVGHDEHAAAGSPVHAEAIALAAGAGDSEHVEIWQDVVDPQPVEVRQVVRVRYVDDVDAVLEPEREATGVLERLDEHLEQRVAQTAPQARAGVRVGVAVAAGVALLVLGIAIGRILSDGRDAPVTAGLTDRPRAASSSSATDPSVAPRETPVVAEPETLPVETLPVEPVETLPVETPARPAPKAPEAAEVAPPPPQRPDTVTPPEESVAIASAPAEPGPAEGQQQAASLAPPVPRPLPDEPDPLKIVDTASPAEAPPPSPPAEPKAVEPEVRAGALVDIASVDIAPKPMQRAIPEYPKRAKKKKHEGRVSLRLLIDEKGNVVQVELADGAAESELADAAQDAARQWRYTPALKGKHRVRVWKPVTVTFSLEAGNVSRVRVEE